MALVEKGKMEIESCSQIQQGIDHLRELADQIPTKSENLDLSMLIESKLRVAAKIKFLKEHERVA